MANRFNFTTKLGLDAAGFKAGVNKVRGSINSLKSSFLSLASALGAGLGFTQLVSNLKNTAIELSIAENTLKNVSYQTKKLKGDTLDLDYEVSIYAENLAFVKKLSNEYAQDLVAVTDNYAKFTAACKKTDLALEDQRMIFESLTKAAAYYHLSADRTADMMNAVTQMMSKGKIVAEELRRQLGNSLPGAFNIMAAAVGVSNTELNEMMADGQLLASKYLPRFAAMLNQVTQTAEFDSLQASINKVKNAWYELVHSSDAENLFKGIINSSTKALNFTTQNIGGIKTSMWGLITYITSVKLFDHFIDAGDKWVKGLEKDLKAAQSQMMRYTGEMVRLQKENQVVKSSNGVITPMTTLTDDKLISKVKMYNRALLESKSIELELGRCGEDTFNAIKNEVTTVMDGLGGLDDGLKDNIATVGGFKKAWIGVQESALKAVDSIGKFFSKNWFAMVLAAVAAISAHFIRWHKELKAARELTDDYENNINGVTKKTSENAALMENYLEIVKDTTQEESARLLALQELNKMLGKVAEDKYDLTELDNIKGKYEEITQEVENWIKATKQQAIIQAYASHIADATYKKGVAEGKLAEKEAELAQKQADDLWRMQNTTGENVVPGRFYLGDKHDIKVLKEEIASYDKIITDAQTQMKNLGADLKDFFNVLVENEPEKELKGLAKIIADFDKNAEELGKQLTEDAISIKEYNEEMDKLLRNAFKAAAATGEVSMETILKKMDKGKALNDFEKWYLDIRNKSLEFAQNVILDTISESIAKDLDEALEKEAEELEKEFEKILENDNKRRQINLDYAGATSDLKYQNSRNNRDGTFDYKKTRADIFSEEADIANENLDRVMDKIKELLDKEKSLMETTGQGLDSVAKQELESLREYARELSKNAATIEEAYRFEQIREDIKNFEKEMTSGVISGIENFATSMDRVVSGAKQLRDIMENVDSTGWEKIMGVVNYIFNILNAVTSIIETVNTLTEISNMLAGARSLLDDKKNADAAIELEGTVAQIAAEEALAGIKAKEAAFETAITSNKVAQAEAALGVATAIGIETAAWVALSAAAKDAAMAIAAANAAAAAGPAAPAAALAAATSVGAGLTTAMAAFAKGGIVGGNSTHGDRNIARVNSGEMILNKAQQGTLFNMLNGKGGLGGNVEFKIRGADLVGTINNYMSRKRG